MSGPDFNLTLYGVTLDDEGSTDHYDTLAEALEWRKNPRQRILRVTWTDITDEVAGDGRGLV